MDMNTNQSNTNRNIEDQELVGKIYKDEGLKNNSKEPSDASFSNNTLSRTTSIITAKNTIPPPNSEVKLSDEYVSSVNESFIHENNSRKLMKRFLQGVSTSLETINEPQPTFIQDKASKTSENLCLNESDISLKNNNGIKQFNSGNSIHYAHSIDDNKKDYMSKTNQIYSRQNLNEKESMRNTTAKTSANEHNSTSLKTNKKDTTQTNTTEDRNFLSYLAKEKYENNKKDFNISTKTTTTQEPSVLLSKINRKIHKDRVSDLNSKISKEIRSMKEGTGTTLQYINTGDKTNDTFISRLSTETKTLITQSFVLSAASRKNRGDIIEKPPSVPKYFNFELFKIKMDALNMIFESELIYFANIVTWGSKCKNDILSDEKISISRRVKLAEVLFYGIDDIINLHTNIIESIIEVNQSIWPRKLKDRYMPFDLSNISNMHFSESIGDLPSIETLNTLSYTKCFLKYINIFSCYIKYVTTLPRSEYELELEYKKNEYFQKTLQYFFKQNNIKNLGIKHFLFMPLNKIERYNALFNSLYKKERDFIEQNDISLIQQRIKSINKKMNKTFNETKISFETFKLIKEIKYSPDVKRPYPLTLFYKHQKIIKQGFYNIILDETKIVKGKIAPKEYYLIILTNLLLICQLKEYDNHKIKAIIANPHHLAKTTASFEYNGLGLESVIEHTKKNRNDFFPLYIVEEKRDNVVVICFNNEISRRNMKKTINDATFIHNKRINKKIELQYTRPEKDIYHVSLAKYSKYIFEGCSSYSDYDDFVLKYDSERYESEIEFKDDQTELDSDDSINNDKMCCISSRNQKCIHNMQCLNVNDDIVDTENKNYEKGVEKPQIKTCNDKTIFTTLSRHITGNYIDMSDISFGISENKYKQIYNRFKLFRQKNLDKNYQTNNELSVNSVITSTLTVKTLQTYKYAGIEKNIKHKSNINQKIKFSPSINLLYNQNKDLLVKRHLKSSIIIPKINQSMNLVTEQKIKLKEGKKVFMGVKALNKFYSQNKQADSNNSFEITTAGLFTELPPVMINFMLIDLNIAASKDALAVAFPKLVKIKNERNKYQMLKKLNPLFFGLVDKFVYDNKRNFLVFLSNKKLYCGFIDFKKPMSAKIIVNFAKNFSYNKKTSTLAVVEETVDKSTCIIIYKLELYNNNGIISPKNKNFMNRIDKSVVYNVESPLGPLKLQELVHYDNTGVEIRAVINTKLYFGSYIKEIFFQGNSIVIISQEMIIINLATFKSTEVIDPLDFAIPYYTKHSSKTTPIKLLQVSGDKTFVLYSNCGFFVDSFGRNISNHRVFAWIYLVNDGKLFKSYDLKSVFNIDSQDDWICLLSDNGIEMWNIETGELMYLKHLKNLVFLKNLEFPLIHDEWGVRCFKMIE